MADEGRTEVMSQRRAKKGRSEREREEEWSRKVKGNVKEGKEWMTKGGMKESGREWQGKGKG